MRPNARSSNATATTCECVLTRLCLVFFVKCYRLQSSKESSVDQKLIDLQRLVVLHNKDLCLIYVVAFVTVAKRHCKNDSPKSQSVSSCDRVCAYT
jgi:hypothetical protein